jgi:hypothetical protein
MEFIRGFIIPSISFYFTLRLPNILCISDAISLWSQKFKTRELKAVLAMFSGLLEDHQFDFNDLNNKEKSSQRVADYIRRIMSIIPKKFKDIGIESKICLKSNIELEYNPSEIDNTFRSFVDSFSSMNIKDCDLHLFISKHNSDIQNIIKNRDLTITGSKPDGFRLLVDVLNSTNYYTCKSCSKIGDVIIALISPDNMRLEHTDYSFDYLMKVLNKKNFRHPSEVKLNKNS